MRVFQSAKMRSSAVGQQCINGLKVVHHIAVAQRTRTTAVVASHTAKRRAITGGHVDRVKQAMGFQKTIELIQHQPGFYPNGPPGRIEISDLIEILGGVHHQRGTDRLTDLRGASSTRQHRNTGIFGDLQRAQNVLLVTRYYYANRLDLVNRCISAVATPAEGVEQDLTFKFAL